MDWKRLPILILRSFSGISQKRGSFVTRRKRSSPPRFFLSAMSQTVKHRSTICH
uniref:Uncharacterized protein n=1 Tax=Anguilla anguilla TaxID=7936 RepID=A0A0E9VWY3_ANGAN